MRRVKMMQHFGVTPYLVFDGGYLPSKSGEEAHRRKRRQESRQAGLELLKAGKPSLAHKELQKSIDITPEMARRVIDELKKLNLPYVVAPYEADAQMVYLEREGAVGGICSEDSDLLVFGAKRLLTKLDDYGQCIEINRREFAACRDIHMADWTDAQFRQMAIFRGCDYLGGIKDLGLKTAYRMLRKHKTPEKVIQRIQLEGKLRVPPDFYDRFRQAELTFLYQRVFCPKAQELVFLTPLPEDLDAEQMPFIGAFIEPSLAQGIAVGDLNPITKETIVDPLSPESRKRRASQSNFARQLPPKKPIDSYFKKDRRIPLGNMDPNCFEVNPQRVATMTENGQRPIVFPLPRPYIEGPASQQPSPTRRYTNQRPSALSASRTLRRRTEPISNILTDAGIDIGSTGRRRTVGPSMVDQQVGQQNEARHNSHPTKKARLCDDSIVESTPSKETSKFFPKSAKASTSAKGDGYLMSDDSIEDVLRDLPDVDGWQTKKKQFVVFEEATQETQREDPKDGEHQEETEAADTTASEEAVTSRTPRRSSISHFAFGQNTRPSSPSSRYSSSSQPTPASSIHSSWITRSTPASSISSVGTVSTAQSTPATPLMTPLQRLGARALNSNKQSSTPTFAMPRPIKRSSAGRRSLDNLPVNPSFVPLPPVDLEEVEALHRTEGSEDMMIPENENGNGEEQENLGKRGDNGRLDLSRFLFA
jgi:exonuclease 1